MAKLENTLVKSNSGNSKTLENNLSRNDLRNWKTAVLSVIDKFLEEIEKTQQKAQNIKQLLVTKRKDEDELSDAFGQIVNTMKTSHTNLTEYRAKFVNRLETFLTDIQKTEKQAGTDLSASTKKLKSAASRIKNNEAAPTKG